MGVRKAWHATFQPSCAGQGKTGIGRAVGRTFQVEGTACAKTRGGKSKNGKKVPLGLNDMNWGELCKVRLQRWVGPQRPM